LPGRSAARDQTDTIAPTSSFDASSGVYAACRIQKQRMPGGGGSRGTKSRLRPSDVISGVSHSVMTATTARIPRTPARALAGASRPISQSTSH
jgi:hypothetical protein